MHPFSKARERTRALNAAKMDRMFAKPFLDVLWFAYINSQRKLGWRYTPVFRIVVHAHHGHIAIILHNASTRSQIFNIPQAHKGKVSGLCFSPDEGRTLLSCGVDKNIKLWSVDPQSQDTVRLFSFAVFSYLKSFFFPDA
jgi:WD repeat and SOF domain-containing protein 1